MWLDEMTKCDSGEEKAEEHTLSIAQQTQTTNKQPLPPSTLTNQSTNQSTRKPTNQPTNQHHTLLYPHVPIDESRVAQEHVWGAGGVADDGELEGV